jgi:hypothetical protein
MYGLLKQLLQDLESNLHLVINKIQTDKNNIRLREHQLFLINEWLETNKELVKYMNDVKRKAELDLNILRGGSPVTLPPLPKT